ncbi:MAG: rhomboid family intramembrane serine protease [Bacteroidales bacterium]|jgi:membrane associated rhomboid family serine protease|nr:rhomboid family intramembrane serine protease [Bacteroidales bacterium]
MTLVLIAITSLVSVLALSNKSLFYRLQFNAYQIYHRKEYYRLLTHGFVHANWWHLIVNMLVLYFFGVYVEQTLKILAAQDMIKFPLPVYLILYLSAIVFASTISLIKFRDDPMYNSVGASGAVSAVVFFSIFFEPWQKLYLYGLIGIPGIIFAILYLLYAQYMSRRGGDNINHDAHFLGAVFGFVFPLFIDFSLFKFFLSQLGIL